MSKKSKAEKKAAKNSENSSAPFNNVLIAENFKALRYGKYAEANGDSKEFMLDFDDLENLTAATLREIAKKNKVEVSGKKANKTVIAEELQAGLAKRKIPEQNSKPDSMIVAEIVAAGVEKGLDDEDMIVQIIDAGLKYKAAGRMFAHAMAEGGHRISTKERKEKIGVILAEDGGFEPETAEEVTAMVTRITDDVAETTESQAIRFIKTHCKTAEIDFPKPVKAPKGGFRKQVQDWVAANPLVTKGEFTAYITEERNKEDKVATRMWPAVEFAQRIAAATIALSDQETDDDDDSDDDKED